MNPEHRLRVALDERAATVGPPTSAAETVVARGRRAVRRRRFSAVVLAAAVAGGAALAPQLIPTGQAAPQPPAASPTVTTGGPYTRAVWDGLAAGAPADGDTSDGDVLHVATGGTVALPPLAATSGRSLTRVAGGWLVNGDDGWFVVGTTGEPRRIPGDNVWVAAGNDRAHVVVLGRTGQVTDLRILQLAGMTELARTRVDPLFELLPGRPLLAGDRVVVDGSAPTRTAVTVVWNWRTATLRQLDGHRALALSPDSSTVLLGPANALTEAPYCLHTAPLADTLTATPLGCLAQPIQPLAFAFAPDSTRLAILRDVSADTVREVDVAVASLDDLRTGRAPTRISQVPQPGNVAALTWTKPDEIVYWSQYPKGYSTLLPPLGAARCTPGTTRCERIQHPPRTVRMDGMTDPY